MDDNQSARAAKELIERCRSRQELIADRRRALERQRKLLFAQREQLAIQQDWLSRTREKVPG